MEVCGLDRPGARAVAGRDGDDFLRASALAPECG